MEQRPPGPRLSPETLAAQALGQVDLASGGLTPAISPSTTYEQQPDSSYRQDRVYIRADNPTYEHAEGLLAALEGAGCACALFASGMAAATAAFQSLLPGDYVLASRVLYWGVRKWLAEFALAWGLDVEFVDTTDLEAVAAALRPGRTRLLWVETPANPMWEVTDLAAVCELAHAAGARVAVDNTVATPVHTRPMEFGADDPAGAAAAAARIRQVLDHAGRRAHEPLLVEAYVPGWELSIDGLLTGGELQATAIFDKPDTPDGPTFEETVLVTPSRLPQPTLSHALTTAERAATALGLRHSPIHAELRLDARGRGQRPRPTMLELAARSIGGLCSRALRFLDGASLEELVLANALGRRVPPHRLARPAGVLMLPVERAGVLRAVDGRADALAVPGITGLSITIPPGQTVHPLPDGDRYLGFVFAEAATYQGVEEALRAARQRLRVVME